MQDLNALIPSGSGWLLTTAWGLNDYGQIVARGRFNTQYKAVLLNPPAPSAPTGLTTAVHSSTQIRVMWTDTSPIETAFALWRKIGAGEFVRIAVLPPNTALYVEGGLTPGTTCTYRVRAIGLGGASAWAGDAAATIPLPPLGAPAGLTAHAVSPTQVNLAWTDGSSAETGIGVWRQTGGVWERIGVSAPNATSFADTAAAASTSYTYRLRAHNSTGASAWSNEAADSTPATP